LALRYRGLNLQIIYEHFKFGSLFIIWHPYGAAWVPSCNIRGANEHFLKCHMVQCRVPHAPCGGAYECAI